MTATNASARRLPPKSMQHGRKSATTLLKLQTGDEYIVEWNDGDRQRYRVEEVRGDYIVRKRWIAHLNRWTEWDGVQKISEVARHTVEIL